MQSPCCLYVCVFLHINSRMPEQIFLKLDMYIMAPEPISTAYFINPSRQSVCMYVYPRVSLLGNGSIDTFQWQRIQATVGGLLEASFSIRSVSYQMRVCAFMYSPIVAR
jgi:hypothetical protein